MYLPDEAPTGAKPRRGPWLTTPALIEMSSDNVIPGELLNEEIVPVSCACPNCGERRMDELVWDDDGYEVTCTTCGTVYKPGAADKFYGEE